MIDRKSAKTVKLFSRLTLLLTVHTACIYVCVYACMYTVNDKKYTRENLHGFRRFSMNHESFPYECFEQWQHFNTDEAKAPYIWKKSSESRNFSLA